MTGLKVNPAKIRLYGLVRDSDGNPLFDDILNVHPEIIKLLTETEKQRLDDQIKQARRETSLKHKPYIWS